MFQNFYSHADLISSDVPELLLNELHFSYNTIKIFLLYSTSIYTENLYFSFISNLSSIPLLPIMLASVVSLDRHTTSHTWSALSHMQLTAVKTLVGAERILSAGTPHEVVALHSVTMATAVPLKSDL